MKLFQIQKGYMKSFGFGRLLSNHCSEKCGSKKRKGRIFPFGFTLVHCDKNRLSHEFSDLIFTTLLQLSGNFPKHIIGGAAIKTAL